MKLLKFDTINPELYLNKKINENREKIDTFGREEMRDWIISLRSNFSDFYTYYLKKSGWEAEEFIVSENYFEKVAEDLYGSNYSLKKFTEKIKDSIRPVKQRWRRRILVDYIKKFKPDVIFVREVIGIPSEFWKYFSDRSLLVSRLAASLPNNWSPLDWDLILTSTQTFKNFFLINKINSVINQNGFDERLINEVKTGDKKHDFTFVGGLGNRYWKKRTQCAEYLSCKTNFKWWGIKGKDISDESQLSKSYNGILSGLEMLQVYRDSKIVFNDYGEIAEGEAVNQRIFEVMGIGSMLLTRQADNILKMFPPDTLVTYRDEKDCADKVHYFLKNEKEREEIALKGQKYIHENFNYKNLMKDFDTLIRKKFNEKFPNSKSRW